MRDYLLRAYGTRGMRASLEHEVTALDAQLGELLLDPEDVRRQQRRAAQAYARSYLTCTDRPAYQNLKLACYRDAIAKLLPGLKEYLLQQSEV